MAFIALIAIVIGIIGTWALVIVNSLTGGWESAYPEISEEEIQQYLETLSGSTSLEAEWITIETGAELIDSGEDISSEWSEENDNENTDSEAVIPQEESGEWTEEIDENLVDPELEAEIDIQTWVEISDDADIIENIRETVSE